ncbi:glycine zipper 2TM domain-containing protein [Sphingopyxis yananensis]|uniref:glycine zipper 2TM domain-containing protein n=1 Tax=Sphingopyxis yananensis TaxID=2886687 RepID=UPI001D116CD7|nr:glycine zipper 2TM domain-containing protein [Sphingopyxis yananensis]MCC2602168.1 glycine zipper 2TM domain-containing protein [Sphingopyxis yananensis]
MLTKFKGATIAALSVAIFAAPAHAGMSAATPATTLAAPTKISVSTNQDAQFDRQRDRERRYARDQRVNNNTRIWRGNDGRYRCKKDNGTTGLLIGGAVGGLAGNTIAGNGDKLLGTVIGAGAGALLGREIDRDKYRCR